MKEVGVNKFVKRELERCRVGLPYWDNDTTEIIIPYGDTAINDDTHEIVIKNYIINEPANFTLSYDWNNGTVPPETNMQVKFVDTKGKMTKVDGIGITTNVRWSGWLPNKGFEVI